MNDELNKQEVSLVKRLKQIGDDEESIIGIMMIAIQEGIVDEVLDYIDENGPEDFSEILEFICPDAEPLEISDEE